MDRIDRMNPSKTRAIRCEHDGLKMAEVKAGCLILRQKHHGETHVQIVPLRELIAEGTPRPESDSSELNEF